MRLQHSVFIALMSWITLCASPLERLIEAIDNQDTFQILSFFDNLETTNLTQARQLLNQLYAHYHHRFGEEKSQNRSFYSSLSMLSLQCRPERSIGLLVSCAGKRFSKVEIFKLKQLVAFIGSEVEGDDLPANLVLGGVEMLVGALICILPIPGAKWAGGFLITDGIHRTFNGLGELDEENRQRLFGLEEHESTNTKVGLSAK